MAQREYISSHMVSLCGYRVVATVIGTYKLFLRITLFTNQFVNKNMHTCFYIHLALQ